MAQRTRIRRKTRRGRPQVRRAPTASAKAVRAEAKQGLTSAGGLMIGGVQDPAEKAADRMADRVMRMGAPLVQRKDAERKDEAKEVKRAVKEPEEDKKVHAKASPTAPAAPGTAAAPASPGAAKAIGALDGGRPLASAERAFFEPRIGADLSDVRLHDGRAADQASKAISARAFTLGHDIAFANGEHQLGTDSGRRLMAHELAHVVEEGGSVRRQPAPAAPPAAPTVVNLNFSGAVPAGQTFATPLRASTDTPGVTWSIVAGTAAKAAGTSIAANGTITLDPAQAAGTLVVRADNAAGFATADMRVTSIPTGVSSTAFSSNLTNAATHYGAAFQNTFVSSNGTASALEGVRVGERFPGAPTPTAATHDFSGAAWPFGARDTFTLSTGTLASNAAGAWTLDSSAQFGPVPAGSTVQQGDNLSTDKALINVGNHIQSSSNPTPIGPLPVTMTLDQDLYWFNPLAAAANRWTKFTTLAHSRTLRADGTNVEFVTTLNGVEHVETYEGSTGVFGLTASPASTPKSAAATGGAAAPAARTVALSVQSLPTSLRSGEILAWSFVGNALGCTVTPDTSDSKLATLTVGTSPGTVTVEVTDMSTKNKARVRIRIT
jgi:hypothetical protein